MLQAIGEHMTPAMREQLELLTVAEDAATEARSVPTELADDIAAVRWWSNWIEMWSDVGWHRRMRSPINKTGGL